MLKPNPSDPALSDARVAANRANAQHSTGPRTPEGKATSSLNALKHGLFSRNFDLAAGPLKEDRAEFDAFAAALVAEYQPEGAEESLLVDRMAALWWRLQRLAAQQQAYLAERLKTAEPLAAVEESEACTLMEARLDRMLRAARKDLLARQGWRTGATARRVAALRRQWDAEKDERLLAMEAREWQATQERLARAQQEDRTRADPARRAAEAEPGAAPGRPHPRPSGAGPLQEERASGATRGPSA